MLVKFVIEVENLLATLASRSSADDSLNWYILHAFWREFECRNRKIRIFRRNRLQKYSDICYKISWCCRKNWWFLRKRRTCICWLLHCFACWFDCIDRKMKVIDAFQNFMFANVFEKLIIEIKILLARFAHCSSTCDFLIWCVLHRFWYSYERI